MAGALALHNGDDPAPDYSLDERGADWRVVHTKDQRIDHAHDQRIEAGTLLVEKVHQPCAARLAEDEARVLFLF